MKFKLRTLTLIIFNLCVLNIFSLWGQTKQKERKLSQRVDFTNQNGFSGHITFDAEITTYGFGEPVVRAESTRVYITGYKTSNEHLKALEADGLTLNSYTQPYNVPSFTITVSFRAGFLRAGLGGYLHKSEIAKLLLTRNMNEYTFPPFSQQSLEYIKEKRKENMTNPWLTDGNIFDMEVKELLLPDLNNRIKKILANHEREQGQFNALLARARELASAHSYPQAQKILTEAAELTSKLGDIEKNNLRKLQKEIETQAAKHTAELAKKEKEEKREKEEKEAVATNAESSPEEQEASSAGKGTDAVKTDSHEEKGEADEQESTPPSAPQRILSATELYEQLHQMTKEAPGMLNDPAIRKQLRDLKIRSDREKNPSPQLSYGRYLDPQSRAAQSSYNTTVRQVQASNQRIDRISSAVGDLTDATANAVVAIANQAAENKRIRDMERANARQAKFDQQKADHENFILNRNRKIYAVEMFISEHYDNTMSSSMIHESQYLSMHASTIGAGVNIRHVPVLKTISNRTIVQVQTNKGMEWQSINKEYIIREPLYIVESNKKFGLLNAEGKEIIAPQLDSIIALYKASVHQFSEREKENIMEGSSFLISKNKKWGEVNTDGRLIHPLQYDAIYILPDNSRLFRQGDTWHLNNRQYTRQQVLELFPMAMIPSMTYAHYKSPTPVYSIVDVTGSLIKHASEVYRILDYNNSYRLFIRGSRLLLLNTALKEAHDNRIQLLDDKTIQTHFQGNIIPINNYATANLWGAIDPSGKMIRPFQYRYLFPMSEGLMASSDGYLDKNWKIVLAGKKSNPDEQNFSFHNGMARFKTRQGYGFIDKSGKQIHSGLFDAAEDFSDVTGMAKIRQKYTEKHLTKDGKLVQYGGQSFVTETLPNKQVQLTVLNSGEKYTFEFVMEPSFHNFLLYKRNNKWGMLRFKEGKAYNVVNPDLYSVTNFNSYGMTRAHKIPGGIGILDTSGNWILPQGKYSQILSDNLPSNDRDYKAGRFWPFYEDGYFAVKTQHSKWNYVDVDGNKLLKEDAFLVVPFYRNVALVMPKEKVIQAIDYKSGKVLYTGKMPGGLNEYSFKKLGNGYFIVSRQHKSNKLYGIINYMGEVVLPLDYTYISEKIYNSKIHITDTNKRRTEFSLPSN